MSDENLNTCISFVFENTKLISLNNSIRTYHCGDPAIPTMLIEMRNLMLLYAFPRIPGTLNGGSDFFQYTVLTCGASDLCIKYKGE
jgi:hypothetical protein